MTKTTRSPAARKPRRASSCSACGGRHRALLAAEERKRLKLSPEVDHYLASRGIPLPTCPPKVKTPEAGELLSTARFDEARVDRVLSSFRLLRHTQGEWAGRPLVPDPWQVAYVLAPVFGWVKRNSKGIWVRVVRELYVDVPRKNGKALDVETPILTARGWRTMGELVEGDLVHAPDGTQTRVVATSEVFSGHECYRVTFSDGRSVVADAGHLWTLRDRYAERNLTVTTATLRDRVTLNARGDRRYSVPVPAALRRGVVDLPLDPYVLGVWLGDGATACGRITSADAEVFAAIEVAGFPVSPPSRPAGITRTAYGLQAQLRTLGVLGRKHVPEDYLTASRAQRLALLRGLMDTDGTVILGSGAPRCEFTSTNRALADAVLALARSLGWKATIREGRATIRGRDCGAKFRVSWNAYRDEPPFTLARKIERLADRPPRPARSATLQVVAVEPVPTRPTRCIEVERADGMYLAGRDLVPTHNSTLCGGLAIYLTAADGEPGAQVLAAATTARQAGFVFEPVKTLAQHSPALKPHVRPLAKRIIHPASQSYFEVVSSVADAQHGANLHGGIVDELHVHKTADLVEAIETGTGSRRQPLIVFITTADDGRPATIYARKRHRVEQLARRLFRHPATYGVVFAAEESDDPFAVETWRKANPGFGISPTREYLETEASTARQSPADLAKFLRLHLGIRTKQATKFIALTAWDASAGIVDEARLAGRRAFGGLDLSSVEDLTALAWELPDGEGGADVLWRFWLPEARLEDLNRRTAGSAEVWVREGWLRTTPGNVIDLGYIKRQILVDADRFDVATIGYDRWGATPLVVELEGEGLTCVPRGQGFASTSAPLRDLQRMTLSRTYRHGGNPVMRWMTDNLAVAMDPSGNVKPDKSRAAEKIDGWSAAVNAHGEAMDNAAEEEKRPAPPPQVARDPRLSPTADIASAGF